MAPFATLLCFVFLFLYLGSSGGDFSMMEDRLMRAMHVPPLRV